jgi:hydrogenase maturation factor HypE
MAEEGTLGISRARYEDSAEPSKEALQRRMEEARDSISTTVTEIRENVAQQVENVKDALDWREHFKKAPVAWTLGAAGAGFFVGYGIAAALSDNDREVHYAKSPAYALNAQPETIKAASPQTSNGKDDGPGLLERFRETSAYDRLSKEVGSLGDRVVEELSATAHQVVLPALLKKLKNLVGLDLSAKNSSMSSNPDRRNPAYEPALERSTEF